MPSFRERLQSLFRYRIGKYDPANLPSELGLAQYFGGVSVTEKQAMGISSVYACIYRIASTISTLDLHIYKRDENGKQIQHGHPVYNLITSTPNENETSVEFWECLIASALATGRGHAIILRDERGRATAMHHVPTEKIEYIQTKAGAAFRVEKQGVFMQEDVFCLYAMQRKSPIRLHAENIGLAKAAQAYGAEWYSDGQMTGILTTDQPLRNEQMSALRESWRNQSAASTRLVPHGLKYQRVSIAPEEAQFIQTRKFQAEEIARIFGVPPALIQLETQTTYNNVEQQNIMYGRHTIQPWVRKIEAEIDRKLLMSQERPATYAKYDLSSMYRGDMEARKNFYEGMVRLGVMSINEVRDREELNPAPMGDTRMVQVNQISLDEFGNYSKKLADRSATASGS